jgi:hypothetical protein
MSIYKSNFNCVLMSISYIENHLVKTKNSFLMLNYRFEYINLSYNYAKSIFYQSTTKLAKKKLQAEKS